MPTRTASHAAISLLALLTAAPARAQQATGLQSAVRAEPEAAAPAAATTATTAAPTTAPSTAKGDVDGAEGRVVGGHVFMPAAVVQGPLLTTSFASGFRLAAGQTSASTTIANRTFEGNLEYAGVGGALAFEYAFLKYFSARVSLDEIIYSGITGKSAIVVGTTGQVGAAVGITASLPLGDSARVGFLFDLDYGPNAGLTIGSGIKAIIDTCQSAGGCDAGAGAFFEQTNVTISRPALALGWAPLPALGVTANVAYEWAHGTNNVLGEINGQAAVLGLALDLDFAAISSVPVGLQTQFRWQAPTSGGQLQHVTDLGFGIFYTGRRHLAAGIQVIDRQFAVVPGVNVSWNTWLTEIGLRYYW